MRDVPHCQGDGCASTTIFNKKRLLCSACYYKARYAGMLGADARFGATHSLGRRRGNLANPYRGPEAQSFRKPTAAESAELKQLRAQLLAADLGDGAHILMRMRQLLVQMKR